MKKIFFFLAVLTVILAALVVLWALTRRGEQASASYETVSVRRDVILASVNASGKVMPQEMLTLNFISGGFLAEINVEVGQKVKAGQQLARLDTRQRELNVAQAEAGLRMNEARLVQLKAGPSPAELAAAEAAVESAQALYETAKKKLGLKNEQLSIAEADLKRAELALRDAQAAYDLVAWRPDIGMLPQAAALEKATIEYERAQANYKLQVAAVDDSAFKNAAAQLAQAKAQLDALRRSPTAEELAIAEAQVEQARIAVEQAKLRLADAVLLAPCSGTVLAIKAEVGELVGAATPFIILGDLDHYKVVADIDETDIGQIKVGQDVVISLDAFPDASLQGKVAHIDPLGEVTQGVVSYKVEIEILPTDVALRPNMTAIVEIVVAAKESALVVPNRAVKRDSGGRYYVEVLAGNEVQQRLVTPGLRNELLTEIVTGLAEGEQVVVSAPRGNILQQFTSSSFRLGGLRR